MQKLFITTLLFAVSFGQVVAGVKPIANLPDYNGTYYGTPNTGGVCDSIGICDSTANRKMYTTLYRDNYHDEYNSENPVCAGERCGKHTGIDIAVASGTQVLASLPGKVIVAECREVSGSGKTGGTVIIEVDNPYVSGDKAYLVYEHLSVWNYYTVNQTVSQGAVIGLSGGGPGDTCRGSSGGSHLHFQVDKNYPVNGKPVTYSGTKTNLPDDDFEVAQVTHNPIPFVLGYAYHYTFAENGNKEFWGATNVNAYNTANSDLWVDSESAYAYIGRSSFLGDTPCSSEGPNILCSREITLDADIFGYTVLNLDFKCTNGSVVIYFRGSDNIWHSGSFTYDYARKYYLNMRSHPDWNGIITDLMIKPSQGCTANPGPEEYFIKQMYLLP